MAGTINQSSIEAVFENLTSDEVEKMSDEERQDARIFLLKEAVRYGAQEFDDSKEYLPVLTDGRIAAMSDEDRASMRNHYRGEVARYAPEEEGGARPVPSSGQRPVPVPAPRQRPVPVPAPRQRPVPVPRSVPETRHTTEQSEYDMRISIGDVIEENARLERRNSLKREFLSAVREQNKLMEEGIGIDDEIAEAEDENTEINLRKEDI